MSDDDDITRNYHGGNPQSRQASTRTRKRQDRARVYAFIHSCGPSGCTCYEAEQALHMRHQTCSARFSDLKKDKAIVGTGTTKPTDTGSPAEICIAVVWVPLNPGPLIKAAEQDQDELPL